MGHPGCGGEVLPDRPPAFYTIPFAYHESVRIHEDVLTAGFDHVQMELLAPEGYARTAADAAVGLLEGSPIHTRSSISDPLLLPAMRTELEARLVTGSAA
ncbi:MAG: hypothetical protein IPG69_07405 [Flavobacteriales bacterium]|nr:hypothetical protein [Flavobacteriales bacterium]